VIFRVGDLLTPVAGRRFDLIVSNPPYVAEGDRDSLSAEVRDYEPAQALFAGADGLAIYRRLIPAAFAALFHERYLALEIGFGQQPAVEALLAGAGYTEIEFTKDLQGIPRVAVAQRP
jgi:release factor glutamine methyltransferase